MHVQRQRGLDALSPERHGLDVPKGGKRGVVVRSVLGARDLGLSCDLVPVEAEAGKGKVNRAKLGIMSPGPFKKVHATSLDLRTFTFTCANMGGS